MCFQKGEKKSSEIKEALQGNAASIDKRLSKMAKSGKITRVDQGIYRLLGPQDAPGKVENSRGEVENTATINKVLTLYDKVLNTVDLTIEEKLASATKIEDMTELIKSLRWLGATVDQLMKRWYLVHRGYDTNTRQALEDAKVKTVEREKEDLENAPLEDQIVEVAHYDPVMKQVWGQSPGGGAEGKNSLTMKRRVISYREGNYHPYGRMLDFQMSLSPVRIADGTYDAGKTFGILAYMHMLAIKYPGSRMTFVHRSLNRVYRNIIPTYEKFLGYKPPSRDDPNPKNREVTRFGGEKPEFFEYDNGTRIYMNGLDKPQNLLSDFFDAGFVNQVELLPFDAWGRINGTCERTCWHNADCVSVR